MGILAFVPFATFLQLNPLKNHSSRVIIPNLIFGLSVADAFLQTISGTSLDISVSDGTLETISSATLELSGTTLTFTSLAVGSTFDMTFTVTNSGTVDLILSSLTATGDFSVTYIARD